MRWHDPRSLLVRALLLDWLGQLLILLGLVFKLDLLDPSISRLSQFEDQSFWLIFCFLLYPLLGWLFGSYTLLRWRRLAPCVLLQRLLITASVTLMAVAIARWFVNSGDEIWLLYWRVQLAWIGALTAWSLFIRIALRGGLLFPDAPRLLLLASDREVPGILQAWGRVAHRQSLEPILPRALEQLLEEGASPLLVALSPSLRRDPSLLGLFECLEMQDPRLVQTISVISLFEKHQERLPPFLLADSGWSLDELPWAAPFSVQAQLKRLADLFVAVVLLLLAVPFLGLAALLIWLRTEGHFYSQQRSGWLEPFIVLKLRSSAPQCR